MEVEGKPELITETQAEDMCPGWLGGCRSGEGDQRGSVGVGGKSGDREYDAVIEGSNSRQQTQG